MARDARRSETAKWSKSITTVWRRRGGRRTSLGHLFKHLDVEDLVGHDALEPAVLPLELLESFGVVGLDTAVLVPPAVMRSAQRPRDAGPRSRYPPCRPTACRTLGACGSLARKVPSMLHGVHPPLSHHGGQEDLLRLWNHSEGSGHAHWRVALTYGGGRVSPDSDSKGSTSAT